MEELYIKDNKFGSDKIHVHDVWVSIVLYFCVQYFCSFILSPAVIKAFPSISLVLSDLIVGILPLIMLLTFFFFRRGKIELADLLPRRRDFLVLFIAVMVLFVAATQIVIVGGARSEINQAIRNLPASQYFLAFCIIVFVNPFLEEAFFRKYILEILRDKYSLAIAILITMGLETLIHLGLRVSGLILIFFYSLFFTLVYLKSRLGVSVMVHSLTNALVLHLAWH